MLCTFSFILFTYPFPPSVLEIIFLCRLLSISCAVLCYLTHDSHSYAAAALSKVLYVLYFALLDNFFALNMLSILRARLSNLLSLASTSFSYWHLHDTFHSNTQTPPPPRITFSSGQGKDVKTFFAWNNKGLSYTNVREISVTNCRYGRFHIDEQLRTYATQLSQEGKIKYLFQ